MSKQANTATSTEASVLSEATARPWRLRTGGNIGNSIEAYSGKHHSELDDGYRIVASFQECGPSEKYMDQLANGIANGALIVRAVNNHDALVKALEKCRKELLAVKDGSVGGIPNSICALIPEAIEQADAALNSVRGAS